MTFKEGAEHGINKRVSGLCSGAIIRIKVFGDPDDETIAQVRCPPLEIPAEGAVRKADLFGKFGLGDLPVFDKVLDTLSGIAGEISVGHGGLFSGQGLLISEILIP